MAQGLKHTGRGHSHGVRHTAAPADQRIGHTFRQDTADKLVDQTIRVTLHHGPP